MDVQRTTAPAERAKVFMTGRSQAVRIPAAYRFTTDEVYIRRDAETGEIVLSPVKPKRSWAEIFKMLDEIGPVEDFLDDRDQGTLPERGVFDDWVEP